MNSGLQQTDLRIVGEPVFYKVKAPMSNESLSYLIHKGVTHIYEGNLRTKVIPKDIAFLFHVHPKLAYETDVVPLLRVFFSHNSHLQPRDLELALTAIFEGWSNALLWGTLNLPPQKHRERAGNFDVLLSQRVQDPAFSHRFMTLLIRKSDDKIIASIRDQGWERPFAWQDAFIQTRVSYKGLNIIKNCCDRVLFDDVHKTLYMEFHIPKASNV